MVSMYLIRKCKRCIEKKEFEELEGTVARMHRSKKSVVDLYWVLDEVTSCTRKIWDVVFRLFSSFMNFKIRLRT